MPAELEARQGSEAVITSRELDAYALLETMAKTRTPTFKDWRELCEGAGVVTGKTPEARRKAMARVRDQLIAAGYVEHGMTRDALLPVRSASSE